MRGGTNRSLFILPRLALADDADDAGDIRLLGADGAGLVEAIGIGFGDADQVGLATHMRARTVSFPFSA